MADDNLSANFNTNSSNSNLNITPDMISNLVNMLKSNDNSSSQEDAHSSAQNNSFNSSNAENSSSNNFSNIDFETILKIKSIMETLNKKDDPKSNLLYSLKPYLRESRQKKLDQYVNLLKITQVTNLFKNDKGDES